MCTCTHTHIPACDKYPARLVFALTLFLRCRGERKSASSTHTVLLPAASRRIVVVDCSAANMQQSNLHRQPPQPPPPPSHNHLPTEEEKRRSQPSPFPSPRRLSIPSMHSQFLCRQFLPVKPHPLTYTHEKLELVSQSVLRNSVSSFLSPPSSAQQVPVHPPPSPSPAPHSTSPSPHQLHRRWREVPVHATTDDTHTHTHIRPPNQKKKTLTCEGRAELNFHPPLF